MANQPVSLKAEQSNNNTVMIFTAGVFFALGFLLAYLMYSGDSSNTTDLSQDQIVQAVQGTFIALTPTPTPPPTAMPVAATIADHSPIIGDADAPVVMVEFTSFTCPYCGNFHREVLPFLIDHYGDLFAYASRDFPRGDSEIGLNIAGQCASEQDKFWEFSRLIWNNQVADERLALNDETMGVFASEVALDIERFDTCRSDEAIRERVLNDYYFGWNLGVNSTPTFFINGLPTVGGKPLHIFLDMIDAELRAQGIEPPSRVQS